MKGIFKNPHTASRAFGRVSCDNEAKVVSYMAKEGNGMVVWSPVFRRHLRDSETQQLTDLLSYY